MIIKGFPEKIVKLNQLLDTSHFQNRDLADVHQVCTSLSHYWLCMLIDYGINYFIEVSFMVFDTLRFDSTVLLCFAFIHYVALEIAKLYTLSLKAFIHKYIS